MRRRSLGENVIIRIVATIAARKRLWAAVLVLIGAGAVVAGIVVPVAGIGGSMGLSTRDALLALVGLGFLLKGLDLFVSLGGLLGHGSQVRRPLPSRWVVLLGAMNVACLATYAVLSYGLAPLVPFGDVPPFKATFSNQLAQILAFLGRDVQAFVTGKSVLNGQGAWLLAYSLPVVGSTAVSLALLMLLARHREGLDKDTPKRLFRWATASAAISALAIPVLVKDFWYGLAWGRMVAAGANVYHTDISPEFVLGLPLGEPHPRMMYGPLWTVVCGAVMWLAGGRALLGAALFKLLLAGAWIGSLWLIWSLLKGQPLWHQCVGIVIFGWLPLGVMQAVADGHNDILLVILLLLWLHGLERGRAAAASLSLAASVLVKYVTLPLFLLDVLHLRYSRRQRLSTYLPRMIAALALLLVGLGLFCRSPDFFSFLFVMRGWHFYTPRDALQTLEIVLGRAIPFSAGVLSAFFFLLPLYFIVGYIRQPEPQRLREAALALMSGLLFGSVTSHIWPWYLLWVLGLAAVVPASALTRWVVGVALAMPFPLLVLMVFPRADAWVVLCVPALMVYAFAVLWFVLAPRRWFPAVTPSAQGPSGIPEVQENPGAGGL